MDMSPFHNSHYNDAVQNSGGGYEILKHILSLKKINLSANGNIFSF